MMIAADLSSQIITALTGVSEPGGINKLWTTVCTYVSANAEVPFMWVGATTTTPPTIDGVTAFTAKINTSLGATLTIPPTMERVQTAAEAMNILSTAMNASIARWTILFPIDQLFVIPIPPAPVFVVPTPGVILTPSGAVKQKPAMDLLCEQIITGIKLLQIPPNAFYGSHSGIYMGVATYIPETIM